MEECGEIRTKQGERKRGSRSHDLICWPGFTSVEKPASEGRFKHSQRCFDHINGREKQKFYCCVTFTRTNKLELKEALQRNGLNKEIYIKFRVHSPLQRRFLGHLGGERLASDWLILWANLLVTNTGYKHWLH